MKKYKHMAVWTAALAGILLAVNVCFDLCCYWNYRDKIAILEQVTAFDEQSKLNQINQINQIDQIDLIDLIIGLIRSENFGDRQPESEKLSEILEQYGYDKNFHNRYYIDFVRQCAAAAVCSVILAIAVTGIFWLQERRWYKIQEQYFLELERCLISFRENKEPVWDMLQVPDTAKGLEDALVRVNDQLVMLADYLTLMREQSYMEKEETKRLVTDISHQLKTPVAALDTCFSVLAQQDLSVDEREEFDLRCRNELEGLKSLLDSLIQISRMEAGMIQIKCRQGLILDTIVKAVNRIYPKASDKQQELVFDYAPEIEQLLIGHDAQWMCEVFINILDNAVKYSPAGSEICIGVQQFYSFVRIEITDQGIGIPKQERHKVFKRFYRGGSMQVRRENGSGVGLYLARKIVGSHHGVISVHTKYDKNKKPAGSRFIVQLPIS